MAVSNQLASIIALFSRARLSLRVEITYLMSEPSGIAVSYLAKSSSIHA